MSVDGTHIRANVSKYKNVRYDRVGQLERQLRKDVEMLLGKAESQERKRSAVGGDARETADRGRAKNLRQTSPDSGAGIQYHQGSNGVPPVSGAGGYAKVCI